jgi:hypothetical protein
MGLCPSPLNQTEDFMSLASPYKKALREARQEQFRNAIEIQKRQERSLTDKPVVTPDGPYSDQVARFLLDLAEAKATQKITRS